MAKDKKLTKAQQARLDQDPALRSCFLDKSKYMSEPEAFAACTKEARELAQREAVQARAAKKEAAKKAADAKKAAEKQEKARQTAASKAKTAVKVEGSKASPARKARARGAAKLARKTAQKDRELAKVSAEAAGKSILKASSAQARTVAMHAGVAPAPAVEAVSLDADALILLPEAERKKVLAQGGKSQRKLLRKELSTMARRVRSEIRDLKSARRQRLRVLKTRAKEALGAIRRRIVEVRTRYLQEMAKLKAETAETRSSRVKGIEEVAAEVGAALSSATARQKAIRDTQSEIRAMGPGPTPKQLAAKNKRLSDRNESNDAVARELEIALPGSEKWWRAEGEKQARFSPKNVPSKMSRAEHVMHALHASPQILDDFFEKRAAAVLRAKEAEAKALSKKLARKEIQRSQRATRRFGRLAPRGPSRGRVISAPAPFLNPCPRSLSVRPWGSILARTPSSTPLAPLRPRGRRVVLCLDAARSSRGAMLQKSKTPGVEPHRGPTPRGGKPRASSRQSYPPEKEDRHAPCKSSRLKSLKNPPAVFWPSLAHLCGASGTCSA